jgi:aldose 1-epimerase
MSKPAFVQLMSGDLLHLHSANLELSISPTAGGSILGFWWMEEGRKISILRSREGVPESILEAASFPLVPYVNRIKGGTFRFRGRNIRLAPNMPGDCSPLHGQGWLSPWDTEHTEEDSATLAFWHHAGEWPWDYEARQEFRLDETGLSLDLACHNRSIEPMPCGLGQHPYFRCTKQTRLSTGVETAWTVDEHVLPVEQVPATGLYDIKDRMVCGQGLDNGFSGWSGSARISDPDLPFDIRLSSPQARFFQLYSPAADDFFVAEPVTHANAALNEPEGQWEALGIRVLEPGEEMRLTLRLEVTQL